MNIFSKKFLFCLIILFPFGLFAAKKKKAKKKDNDIAFLNKCIENKKKSNQIFEKNKKKIISIIFEETEKLGEHSILSHKMEYISKIVKLANDNKFKEFDYEIKMLEDGFNKMRSLVELLYLNLLHDSRSTKLVNKLNDIAQKLGVPFLKNNKKWSLKRCEFFGPFASMLKLFHPRFLKDCTFIFNEMFVDEAFCRLLKIGNKMNLSDHFFDFCFTAMKQYKEDQKSVEAANEAVKFKLLILHKKLSVFSWSNIFNEHVCWASGLKNNENHKSYLQAQKEQFVFFAKVIFELKNLKKFLDKGLSDSKTIETIHYKKNNNNSKKKKINSIVLNKEFEESEKKKSEPEKKTIEQKKTVLLKPKLKDNNKKNTYFYHARVARWFDNPNDALNESKSIYTNSVLSNDRVIAFHAFWPIVDDYINFGIMKKNKAYTSWSIPGLIIFNDGSSLEGVFEYVYLKTKDNNLCIHRWFRSKRFATDFQKNIIPSFSKISDDMKNDNCYASIQKNVVIDDYKTKAFEDRYVHITKKVNDGLLIKSITLYNSKYI